MRNETDRLRRAREHHERDGMAPESPESRTGSPREIGGPSAPEPTRYGDWEAKGRCIDF